jgi:hypothetical protein
MPFWISTIGLPVSAASRGERSRSEETMTTGIGRPWADVPKNSSRSSGAIAVSSSMNSSVSS